MEYDEELVKAKLIRWGRYLNHYCLPAWEQLPNVGLYMEQVLILLKEYLDYLPPELKEEQFITAATINNYVQKKFMPEPIKKRYYRVHLAYMIMICTLKHSLSIATLQKLIPVGLPEEKVKEIYTAFALRHKTTATYFADQIAFVCGPMLFDEPRTSDLTVNDTADLITATAIVSALSRLLAEKLLLLEGKKIGDVAPEELE